MGKMVPGKKRGQANAAEDGSLWLNPYLLSSTVLFLALGMVGVYHFFLATPVVRDQAEQAATGGESGKSRFSFFGKSSFVKGPPLEISMEEMEELGISKASRAQFEGAVSENLRDKRRLFTIAKYEGGRKEAEARHREFANYREQHNTPSALALRDVMESSQSSENLALMQLESFVEKEMTRGLVDKNNLDTMIYAYQNLTDLYLKKNLKSKAQDAYLSYLKLLKEKAPVDQGQGIDGAISEISAANVGTSAPAPVDPTGSGN